MTFLAVQVAKDSKTNASGQLVTTAGQPVTVDLTKSTVSIVELPAQSMQYLTTMEHLTFQDTDGKVRFYRIAGFEWKSPTQMTVFSLLGDKINITAQGFVLFFSSFGLFASLLACLLACLFVCLFVSLFVC